MALGLERGILAKACALIWNWTIFVNPFLDPITLPKKSAGAGTMPGGN